MDLRIQYPRSVRDRLGGYVHLARMIDKCQAKLAETLGDYIFPCPLDQQLLDFLGISADQFLEAVEGRSDEDIVAWLARHAKSYTPEEVEAWNRMMLARGPDTEEKWAFFRQVRNAIDPTRTDITTWADLLDLEEERPVPLRSSARSS